LGIGRFPERYVKSVPVKEESDGFSRVLDDGVGLGSTAVSGDLGSVVGAAIPKAQGLTFVLAAFSLLDRAPWVLVEVVPILHLFTILTASGLEGTFISIAIAVTIAVPVAVTIAVTIAALRIGRRLETSTGPKKTGEHRGDHQKREPELLDLHRHSS
jgi:hypothetical protein